jgi:formylmethanofuran dehydrogenase subunit B
MRGEGNVVGADNVLSWRTGFQFAVNLAQGYPRFNPGEYSIEAALARGEVDAALITADDPLEDLSQQATARLRTIPTIVLDSRETPLLQQATVAIRTSLPALETPGTMYRMDGVTLPMRPALTGTLPSDLDVLTQLENRVQDRLALKT